MTNMVEKVARAIDPGAFMPMSCHVSVGARSAAIESAMERARWALVAMLEPTQQMRARGAAAYDESPEAAFADSDEAIGSAFRAMIQAALSSEKTPAD